MCALRVKGHIRKLPLIITSPLYYYTAELGPNLVLLFMGETVFGNEIRRDKTIGHELESGTQIDTGIGLGRFKDTLKLLGHGMCKFLLSP